MLLLPRCVLLHLLLLLPLLLPLLLLFLLFLLLHLFLLSEVDEHKMYYQLTALFMRRAAVFPFMARAADLNNDQPSDTHTHTHALLHTHTHTQTFACRWWSQLQLLRCLPISACCCCLFFFGLCTLQSTGLQSTIFYSLSTVFSCLSLSNSKS